MDPLVKSAICEDERLADTSKRQYVTYVLKGVEASGESVMWICNHPEDYYARVKVWCEGLTRRRVGTGVGQSWSTVNSYLSPFACIVKRVGMGGDGLLGRWKGVLDDVRGKLGHETGVGKPKDWQILIPFADICAVRDALEDGDAKLLLGMYTYIRPMRSDYARVKVLFGGVDDSEDYIDLVGGKIVIRNYKTSGRYGVKTIQLGEELKQLATRVTGGREWLFGYRSDDAYNKWANRVLKSLFGERMTLSGLRHSYVSSIDFSHMTVEEREKIAEDMGHSVSMQLRYDWGVLDRGMVGELEK